MLKIDIESIRRLPPPKVGDKILFKGSPDIIHIISYVDNNQVYEKLSNGQIHQYPLSGYWRTFEDVENAYYVPYYDKFEEHKKRMLNVS